MPVFQNAFGSFLPMHPQAGGKRKNRLWSKKCQRFTCRVLQVSDSLCWIKVLPLCAEAVWQKHLESNTKQEQQQKRKQQTKVLLFLNKHYRFTPTQLRFGQHKTKVLTAIIDPGNGLDYQNSTFTNQKHIQQICYITLELSQKIFMFNCAL